MALFEKSTLKDGVAVREVWGWALFDAANSGYSTVVLTAVFNAYFVGTVCGDADWATFLWTTVVAASNLICLIVMPGIGRAADRQGNKKRWLFLATAVCILATAALLFCREGAVILAAFLVIVSNIGYSVGESLNSAFLPELAKKDALGRVSGWGWSLGYGGGLVTPGAFCHRANPGVHGKRHGAGDGTGDGGGFCRDGAPFFPLGEGAQ